ncbi:MAG: septal ring lytic transglycosylase RlpA family protein [Erythrobacter sp.]|nr:MAG: septal ring lytic transglycosylase RlpA family protein [Erythrobacter sp.]
MDGKTNFKATRHARTFPRVLGGLAALALFSATGAGFAQQDQRAELAPTTASPAAAGPVFVPSEQAQFEEAFAAFETAPEPALSAGAVDITTIEPAQSEGTSLGSGIASYYANHFNGRRTASGETFSNAEMTAAHRTLPFGSLVRVTNPRTGASVVVRINDRGPFTRGRTIDLSRAAAETVGLVRAGHGSVELELLDS